MCGRYTYKLTWEEIVALYRLTMPEEPPEGLRESFNVAPTHLMPIIRPAGNGRELVVAKRGLIPFWSKPEQVAKPAYSTINARDDRIQAAPTYRDSFKKRRCLVRRSATPCAVGAESTDGGTVAANAESQPIASPTVAQDHCLKNAHLRQAPTL